MNGTIGRLTALLCLAIASGSCVAQSFPSKPITLIVPAGAGGVSDVVARRLAGPLGSSLKTTVVVQNIPGAEGGVALQQLANAPADGHTLLLLPASAAQSMGPKAVDVRKMTFVEAIGELPYVLAVPASSAVKELRPLFAKSGRKFTIGGAGSLGLTDARLLADALGPGAAALPFKVSADVAAGLRDGSLDAGVLPLYVAKPLLDSGQLRVLAQTGTKRIPELDSVPTFGQAGAGGRFSGEWYVLIGPAGMPEPVVQALSGATRQALKEVSLKEYAVQPLQLGKADFATLVDSRFAASIGGGTGETCGSGRCWCESQRTCQSSPCDGCTK